MKQEVNFSYAIPKLNIIDYWERGITGKGVKVAIIDGGISPHRDLTVLGGTGINAKGEPVDPMTDENDHGTHVAGIIASNPKTKDGYRGIAYECDLYSCKYLITSKESYYKGIINGVDWAVDNGIDILNMSIDPDYENLKKFPELLAEFDRVFDKLDKSETIGIVACGNGSTGDRYELDKNSILQKYPGVIPVANLDIWNERNKTSEMGSYVKLSSYGTNIMSTFRNQTDFTQTTDLYILLSGTSMATPHVSAIFALYKQLFPSLTKRELIDKVYNNAHKIQGLADYEQGKGIIKPPIELYSLPVVDNYSGIYIKKPFVWHYGSIYYREDDIYKEGTL